MRNKSVFVPRRRRPRWIVPILVIVVALGAFLIDRERREYRADETSRYLCSVIASNSTLTAREIELGCKRAAARIRESGLDCTWHETVDTTVKAAAMFPEIRPQARLDFRPFSEEMVLKMGDGMSQRDFLSIVRGGLEALNAEDERAIREKVEAIRLAEERKKEAENEADRRAETDYQALVESHRRSDKIRAESAAKKADDDRMVEEARKSQSMNDSGRLIRAEFLLAEAKALDRDSKENEALAKYREIVEFYPETLAAVDAGTRIRSITRRRK